MALKYHWNDDELAPKYADALSLTLFDDARSAVRAFVKSPAIDQAAAEAFGPGVSGAAVAAAVHAFDRDGWPKLVLLGASELHGARGAYDQASNTIYLSRDYLAAERGSPEAVKAVLIEEIGHAIDARVHSVDAPGDEGEIFARFVTGHAPSAAELAALHAQNDQGAIVQDGVAHSVEFAAPVVGSVTLDGSLSADWTASDRIDKSLGAPGYEIYGKTSGDSFVFALKAPVPINANTTAWLNTDQNSATGFQVFGFAGGAEYNVNFDAAGTPYLYSGGAGQTPVPGASISFGYSADHAVVEFAVAKSAIGATGGAIDTLWDVNDSTFLPTNYSAAQYEVLDTSNLPARTDFSHRVGIVYSETSAQAYFSPMAYSQLIMSAQNQAAMAGVRYDVLSESDLTNIAKLANYDALVFPDFSHVDASRAGAIESTLKLASAYYHVGLIASGEFMTYDAANAALPGDPYAHMKSLLDLQIVGSGFPADVAVKAGDITHPVMQDYAAGAPIHNYSGVGWLAFAPVTTEGTSVLATQTVGGNTFDAIVATNTGGRNVHFSTNGVMADDNLLSHAIDYVVNGAGVTAGLQLSRGTAIVASRTDMDQAMETSDVSPASGPGIYDKLLPILQDWKSAYDFVGSYYVDIGNNPAQGQATDWAKSGAYYKQLLALGNELGSHSLSHPENTNLLTAAQIQAEFQGSKQLIEQHMSQVLGQPFTVDGVAVPGAPETLPTALSIGQYYSYMSGGYAGVGAGYPGAIGYLDPTLAGLDKVYIAPNVTFDFTNVEFKGLTAAQASAQWQSEWSSLTSHADVPVVVWPWHDYGAAAWSTNLPTASPYATAMYTDFIATAYNAGAEFVTLNDLASRINSLHHSGITTSVSGSVITASVDSPDAGKFALDLDHLGTQRIASVDGWYAYDRDSVFLPHNGGSFTINLGAAAADVTHITSLPMRAELLSLSGNGTDLSFSVFGEGRVLIDLADPAGRAPLVTGASIVSLTGDKLLLDVGAIGRHDVAVALVAPNHAPTITSNGGGDAAAIALAENTTALTSVVATDPDAGQTLAYSIAGGADAARFGIDAKTGLLSFLAAPNFEAPADADHNNSYIVQVRVADSGTPGLSDLQTITAAVTNVNDAPTIASNGAGAAAAIAIPENTTAVTTVHATDEDAGQTPAYAIAGGADAALFGINAQTGALRFLNAPDFETPRDQGANNVYDVIVGARDGAGASDTQALAVAVTNVAGRTLNGNSSFNRLTGAGEEDTLNGLGGSDLLSGQGGNDVLNGGAGADMLDGGAGRDTLIGGTGNDTLTGGADSDRFVFNALNEGQDRITDFATGTNGDVLDIRGVLAGYHAGTSNIGNFVHLSGTNDTTVRVNADGVGWDFTALVTLQGVHSSPTLLADLVAHGELLLG